VAPPLLRRDVRAPRRALEAGSIGRSGTRSLRSSGYADDTTPRTHWSRCPARVHGARHRAAGQMWVIGGSLDKTPPPARWGAGRKRSTARRSRWCRCRSAAARRQLGGAHPRARHVVVRPGGEPVTPLANGSAFGGKPRRPPAAAGPCRPARSNGASSTPRGRCALGPKRPPISAGAVLGGDVLHIGGQVAGHRAATARSVAVPSASRATGSESRWRTVDERRAAPSGCGTSRAAGRARPPGRAPTS
jgi:hypothetical protein